MTRWLMIFTRFAYSGKQRNFTDELIGDDTTDSFICSYQILSLDSESPTNFNTSVKFSW
jgi:hypothetical protein